MNDNWGFSSSSDSESDEDRPVSAIRTDGYYRHFQNGDYGANWPHHILDPNNLNITNGFANSSIIGDPNGSLPNGHASFADISHVQPIDNARIVSPSTILGSAPDDIVLINEGGKFRPIRVITAEKLLAPRKTPDKKEFPIIINRTISTDPNVEHEGENEPVIPAREIPLEQIDFIHPPMDPRTKNERDDYGDEDAAYEGLPLPRFWRETVLKAAQEINRERNSFLNGSFKRSHSYLREKLVQKSQRLSMAPKLRDPRLERTLFEPPRKLASPPKVLNQSQPNMKSLFEDANLDGVSSDSSNFSSEAQSFGSLPSVGEDPFDFNASKSSPKDSDSDDDDFTFAKFSQKRKATTRKAPAAKRAKPNKASTERQKVSPHKMNLRKKRTSPVKKEKKDLFGTPPRVERDDILNALTDGASNDQENIGCNENVKPVKMPQKVKKIAPITHNLNVVQKTSTAKVTKIKPKKEIKEVATVEISDETSRESQSANATVAEASQDLKAKHNESISEKSNSSLGSIEQRLADMISPVKTAAEVHAEQELIGKLIEKALLENDVSQSKEQAGCDESVQSNQIVHNWTDLEDSTPVEPTKIDPLSNGDKIGEEADILSTHSAMDNGSVIQLKNGQDKTETNSPLLTAESIIQILNGNDQAQSSPASAPTPSVPTHDQTTDEPNTTPANLSFELPEIAANAEIYTPSDNLNLDDYTKVLESLPLNNIDIGNIIETGSKEKDVNANVAPIPKPVMDDISDDDFEEDQPCGMDDLILPNSNTGHDADDKLKTECSVDLCSYKAEKGWKQLTKHFVRHHSEPFQTTIPNSYLSKNFNAQELMITTFTPMVTKSPTGMLIQSLCYFCNQSYKMCSEKWLMHFIAHTGEFEFRCNKCRKAIMQDLHKVCNSNNNERIDGPHGFIDNVLYGFVCGIPKCSYIQLSKKNLMAHLENVHQVISADQNIIEITLLKSIQPTDLAEDSKCNTSLVAAKERMSRYIDCTPVEIEDDDSDFEMRVPNAIASIDLTLSDDDD